MPLGPHTALRVVHQQLGLCTVSRGRGQELQQQLLPVGMEIVHHDGAQAAQRTAKPKNRHGVATLFSIRFLSAGISLLI